jgi:hypothetical protein
MSEKMIFRDNKDVMMFTEDQFSKYCIIVELLEKMEELVRSEPLLPEREYVTNRDNILKEFVNYLVCD